MATHYEIALWHTDGRKIPFGYSARTTKGVIAQLLADNGPAILEAVDMPEDFEFIFKPHRITLNDGWTFGKTGETQRTVETLKRSAVEKVKNEKLERSEFLDGIFNTECVEINLPLVMCNLFDALEGRVDFLKINDILWKDNVINGDSIDRCSAVMDNGTRVLRGPADCCHVLKSLQKHNAIIPIEFYPGKAAPWIGLQYGNDVSSLKKSNEGAESYWSYRVMFDVYFGGDWGVLA